MRVLLEVPDGGYNKLMCNSTRLIMIRPHVVARKSAALHEQFEQFVPFSLNSWPLLMSWQYV